MATPIVWVDTDGNEHSFDELFSEDALSGDLISIMHPHHEIHKGMAFTAEHNVAGGSGTKATISFTTPNTSKLCHMLVTMRANVESFYTFGEGATVTASSGSDYVPRNRHRESVNVTGLISAGSSGGAGKVTLGGTVSDFGTVLETLHIGIGKQGGESRDIREWVLKRDTTYALEVESEATSSEVTVEIHYYEIISNK